ncbi:MAG: 2-oxoglutarate dehydrogenase E1 component [Capnocytophaga sp.]|nr:2-oxoglutarate dehydrogenase E1 component [Capnocytophaga sp.]
MDKYSFLNAANTQFFADLYDQYLESPDSVEPSWRAFFQGFDFARENYGEDFFETETSVPYQDAPSSITQVAVSDKVEKEFKVLNLINAYRKRGHLFAKTNPIRERETHEPNLSVEHFGLSQTDLATTFDAAKEIGLPPTSLANIIAQLQAIFCQSIGVEYTYMENVEAVNWFNKKLQEKPHLSKEDKISILHKLSQATTFENFLHNKYVGQKRFSLEGNESLVPALDILIEKGAEQGVEDVIIGMAHRGRLNVLINILNKNPQDLFSEFDGKDYDDIDTFDGDVKYHLGLTSERTTQKGKNIRVNLAPNPSHLEAVAPVIQGISRAKEDIHYNNNTAKVLPIAIHGDAAVAGQGIVYETLQMELLRGYKTGGTIHIITNNQVGFTTNYSDSRSSTYCTDIAKTNQSPVLHINSDDAEAVAWGIEIALEFRMKFGRDIFIDLLGYRKYGHNEGDEPRFTQPILYKIIGKHSTPNVIYGQQLVSEGVISQQEIDTFEENYRNNLDKNLEESRKQSLTIIKPFMENEWKGLEKLASSSDMLQKVDTSFRREKLDEIAQQITTLPENKKFINKIQKIIKDRKDLYFERNTVDWGLAEHLAFGSLLSEGYNVRISGEDVGRGTFSHRHAVIKTEDTEEEFIPLNQIQGGKFHSYNSLLSEYGVLGFEYGYALTAPQTLTIWEAQFGDFANGAQIMIDQYICCGEDKWKNQNGLVMLLPHGFEGQGAEHSSARIERYLQLCSNSNMYVTNCTTPANFFHLLRRQQKVSFRKPLVVFTPKGLLRHPQAISSVEELANGHFQEVIQDNSVTPAEVTTLVFCSGRFYYDLIAEREKLNRKDVAIVRIEQLFPLPTEQLKDLIAQYPNANDFVWAQEEPKNMGAYGYMLMNFDLVPFRLAASGAFSAPASGSHTRDRIRHKEAIDKVFQK